MKTTKIIILVILCLCPQRVKGFDFPFLSSPETEAQYFVDKVIPEIVAHWNEKVLSHYVHPEFYKITPRHKVEEFFFSFRKLGPMLTYQAARGEVLKVKSSSGSRYLNGSYVAEVSFENGLASVRVSIIKENQKWMITAFHVNSEAFIAQDFSERTPDVKAQEFSETDQHKTATEFLQDDNIVTSRRNIGPIFPIAAQFALDGDTEMALRLYEKALKAEPANLEQQFEYAKLLWTEDRKEEARVILRLINNMAEEADLLKKTHKILADFQESSASNPCSMITDAEIVLVPLGQPNMIILNELSPKLEEVMEMTVCVVNDTYSLGEPERMLVDRYINTIFQDVTGRISQLQKDYIINSLSLDENALEIPLHQSRFLMKFFSLLGTEGELARQDYETSLVQLHEQGQYSITRLSQELRSSVPFDTGKNIKVILGVTEKDLFSGNSNFLYGGTEGGYGVISYYRFTAATNQEQQNRPRLVSRLLKQAISSSNFTLDIPRCNTPYCARSFPQNLSEHDAKGEELCDECKRRLEAYKKEPRSNIIDFEYLSLGEKYREEKKWALSAKFFNKVIDNQAERMSEAYNGMGRMYMEQGRYADSDKMFRKFLNQSPGEDVVAAEDLQTAVALGNSFNQLGQSTVADYYFSRVLATDELNVDALVFKGDFYMEKQEDSKAEKYYRRAVEIDPDGFLSNTGMGYYLGDKGKPAEVIKYYEKSLGNIPNDAAEYRILPARYNLAMAYLEQGAADKARKQLEAALEVNPGYTLALNSLGQIYGNNGRLNEAISSFKKAVEFDPDFADAWNNLGYSYYLKKEYREAINYYEKALRISPGAGLFHYNDALAYFALQEFDMAIDHADKAAEHGYQGDQRFYRALDRYRK